jgi:hypothetical protein
VRFPRLIAVCAAFALVGCASAQQKAAKAVANAEKQQAAENSRSKERRRMEAVENGDVNSARGAEILEYSPDKAFNPSMATAAAAHGVSTGKAQSKGFYSDRQLRVDTYQSRAFYDSKSNQASQRAFATNEANTKGRFLNLFARKKADTKTASTRAAWDAGKSAATRPLYDGKRPYLGPESKKMGQSIDNAELANWRTGGESVGYGDSTVERVSTMKQLSVDDIRDLLNKSK